MKNFSQFLSTLSNYFANRKGLLLFIGIALVILNFIFGLFLNNWLTQSNLLLHLGVIIGLFGV
ncbi:MAG TPA: hypothetical protein VK856_05095, partial [Anaerolineaceae bacterium]|nr:hypothetical protein [Anaerolineaceae bacterium]